MAEDFNEYDHGFRLGTFDKCNGKLPRFHVDAERGIFEDGYFDAYNGNVAVINQPTEADHAEQAFRRGEAYGNEIRPLLEAKAMAYGEYSEDFVEGFFDAI